MTLEEMNEAHREAELEKPKKVILCLPPSSQILKEVEVTEEMTCDVPGHVFLAANEEGKMMFMTITDDGRKVPLENW